jgi:Dolichyl-phosphate-mannose-protein mannosyltransferase
MNKRELRHARVQRKRTTAPVKPPRKLPGKPWRGFLRAITSIPVWCLLAASWGAISARLYRDWMNPDGISYLDLAGNALQDGPLALVNAHWSPLYPALIACWKWLFHPTAVQEFAYIHALNGLIYSATAVCFGFFLSQFLKLRSSPDESWARKSIFTAFGFSVFFLYMNADITPFVVTPDLLLACAVFAAAGLFCRILRDRERLQPYLALSCVLALGYYAKSVMLVVGFALLILLAASRRKHFKRVLLAAAVMLLLAAPQIVLVSKRVGHLSMGETGRLNYLWWVNGIQQFVGWTGGVHPPRTIFENPQVLEFATPVAGTYPLWYDPTYWYEGAKARFNASQQIVALRRSLQFYVGIFNDMKYPLAGLAVLSALALWRRSSPNWVCLWLVIWSIGILFMYALEFTEYRYAAPFLIVFWLAAYGAVLKRDGIPEWIVLLVIAVLALTPRIAEATSQYRVLSRPRGEFDHIVAARNLEAMGIRPGDQIATVGAPFVDFYARIARLRVVAQVSDEAAFWKLPQPQSEAIENALAKTGAKALVAKDRPSAFQEHSWRQIPGTRFSVLQLKIW